MEVKIPYDMFTKSGTYPWSFVMQIFHSGQPSHGGDRTIFEVKTLTLLRGTLASVASLLAATLYKRNSYANHKLRSGISYQLRDIYSICRCCWNVATHKWKVHNGKIEIISFVVKFRSLVLLAVNFEE